MKIYTQIFILFIAFSCCGINDLVKTQPKVTEEIVEISAPETSEITKVDESPGIDLPIKGEIESIEITTPETPEGYFEEELLVVKPYEILNHSVFNNLLQKHVSAQGKVNYKGFKSNWEQLQEYIASLGRNMPNDSWIDKDKLAYWINAYNALTIDLILRNPSVKSIKDIKDPWDQRLWKFGSKWYNLNQIEHEVLRKINEPRIHFAIVCASVSCPKLQNSAYTSSNLETQLTNATKEFLSDSSKNIISRNSLKLSKIFKWFAKDFKQKQSLVDFLNKYSDIEISQSASKSYMDYNWNLND